MSYSKKLTTLDTIVSFLAPTVLETFSSTKDGATPLTFEWSHEQPKALAYKIREGFALARMYPDAYPWFTELAACSRVALYSKARVVMLLVNTPRIGTNSRVLALASAASTKIANVPETEATMEPARESSRHLTHTEKASRFDIVARWERAQNSPAWAGRKIAFTNATVTDFDLDKLAAWAARIGWLVIANEEGVVTLTQDNPNLREIAWATSMATSAL